MKNLGKSFRIKNQQFFVDGKAFKKDENFPQNGKVVFCKIYADYKDSIGRMWEIDADSKAVCHDDDSFNYEQGRDIAYARAKRDAINEAFKIEDEISKISCDRFKRLWDAYDYCNFELEAMGAKKSTQQEAEETCENPIKTAAMTQLVGLINNIHKMNDDEVESMLSLMETNGFIR